MSAAGPRRQVVAAALALCTRDQWISEDDLFAAIHRADLSPTVARSARGLWRRDVLGDDSLGDD